MTNSDSNCKTRECYSGVYWAEFGLGSDCVSGRSLSVERETTWNVMWNRGFLAILTVRYNRPSCIPLARSGRQNPRIRAKRGEHNHKLTVIVRDAASLCSNGYLSVIDGVTRVNTFNEVPLDILLTIFERACLHISTTREIPERLECCRISAHNEPEAHSSPAN